MSWDAYDELDIQASSIGNIREIAHDALSGPPMPNALAIANDALRRILRIADEAAVSLDDFNERVQ